jgi:phenylacetate-CoA ligase
VHTGGTTGTPLTFYSDRPSMQRNFAFIARLREWIGAPVGQRAAVFAGRTFVSPDATRPPFWRRNLASNTMLFSSYHISPQTIPDYVAALRRFQPRLIDSYPSSILPIAQWVLDHGVTDIRPRGVMTSSETLDPGPRAVIEQAFGCRVYDAYGAAEMAAWITQCEHSRYHINPEYGVVELVVDGRPAAPGETGEIIATGFINPVMPLIRYATGDLAVASAESCACGRAFDVVERVEGRRDEVVVTPEGRFIGRLDPIFKAIHSVYESQIIQDLRDHVRVELVTRDGYSAEEEHSLMDGLRKRLGPSMRIDIVRVESIPRSRSGKLRSVINLIGKAPS